MNIKYTTTIVMIVMILALSRGFVLHYQDVTAFFGPLTALAEGDGGGGAGGGGDGGGGGGGGDVCVNTPTAATISCASALNNNGAFNVPAGFTEGMVSYDTNSCTGLPENVNTGGCSAPVVVAPPIVWTAYCTGANDPNGNNWQWWAYSDTVPVQYAFWGYGTVANGCAPAAPVAISGCMDSTATNYNPNATVNDGSCTYSAAVVWTNYCTGANDPNGNSWQVWAQDNANSPHFKFVEMGSTANGCVPAATTETPVLGCTDQSATNFNPNATTNDGSCTYSQATCHTYRVGDLNNITAKVHGGTATLNLPSDACPMQISFSSYDLPSGRILPYENQVLIDNITDTYGPGTHIIGPLKLSCNWQTDVYFNDVQTTLSSEGTQHWIASDSLTGQTCSQLPPPANYHAVCAYNTGTGKFDINASWSLVSGAVNYPIRLRDFNNIEVDVGNGAIGDSAPIGTSYTFRLLAPGDYLTWIHSWSPTNGWSATVQQSVTCSCPTGTTWNGNSCATPPPPVPTCVLTANPTAIQNGSSSALSWTTTHGTSFSIDHSVGSVTPVTGGSKSVSPTTTTLYTGTIIGAGGSSTCTATVTVTQTPPPPQMPTCTLSANPASIQTGSSSVLSWTTSNATSFSIDHSVGAVTPVTAGSKTVSPTVTTTYTGTATGAGGSKTCTATVTVTAAPPVPTCTLTANPTSIQTGSSSTLSWTTGNATSFVIDHSVGSVTPVASGVKSVSPTVTTTYTGTATGAGGSKTCTATITVTAVPPVPTCTLTANPNAIQTGDSSTLSWTTSNASSFSIDHSVGSVTPVASGSKSVSPTVTTTYTGTATGAGGSKTCTATITVTAAPPVPTCVLTANPTSIQTGSASTLSWTTTNATSFSINRNIGVVTPVASGSKSVSPIVTTTYTGTVVGEGGSSTCSATVTVTEPPPVPTCTLSANPTSIQTGSSSALSWTTSNASSFSVDQGVGVVTPVAAGSKSVSPTVTTTYTGTATGEGGSVTCTATVTVTAAPPVPTCTLAANPTAIQTGSSSTLSWTTVHATSFTIDHSVGPVTPAAAGSKSVSPTVTTTYTGTATGAGGSTTCTATITVTAVPPVPTCTLTANPAAIQRGDSSTLSWTTSNANTFSINQDIGAVTPVASSSRSVTPTVTTTYTGTATGEGGSVTCTATVTVTVAPPVPLCTLSANPTSIQKGDSSTLSWTTNNATSFSINQDIGAVSPVASSSRAVTPSVTTTYTGTATGEGGSTTCTATVTVTAPPPGAPTCTLSSDPSSITSGAASTLSWATTNATTFSLDQGIGAVTPVASGTTSVSPTVTTTYTGTATGAGGSSVCSTVVTIPPVGCTSNCGGGGGGGGGGTPRPHVTLSALPHVGQVLGAYLYLSQIPQTGLDLGPLGTALYWIALVSWALALAYLILFGAAPFATRSARTFGSRIASALNTPEAVLVSAPQAAPVETSHYPAPETREMHTETMPEAPRGYSTYDGFKSFAQGGTLSIDDIVKSLSRQNLAQPKTEPVYGHVEPIYENVEPITNTAPVAAPVSEPATTPSSTRGFATALVEGDRAAVFAGLRQQVRGGGSVAQLLSTTACLLDDVYRARVDGSVCDADVARLTARLDTPTLEKLVASLTTAIDSSYAADVTGAKLALTRALAVLGA